MNKILSFIIKVIITILISFLLVMGVIAGFIYFYQDSMIFTQTKFPPGKTYNVPSNYETIVFTSLDGYKYKCWFILTKKSNTSSTIMYILGNGSYKEAYIETFDFYTNNIGVNVFACSNRGSGDYEGKPTELSLYEDAEMFFKFISSKTKNNALFLHGRSMGGSVALEIALKHQDEVCGLILENTFLSILKIAKELHPILSYFLFGFTGLIRTKMDNESKIIKFIKPTLFLISRNDEVVKPHHMDSLYELSSSTNKFKFENPKGTHNSIEIGMQREFIEEYTEFIDSFKDECIKEKSKNAINNMTHKQKNN